MSKKKNLMIILFLCTSVSTAAFMPKFNNPSKVKCNGKDINDVSCATMYVADWDGDGKKDLIVGEFSPNQKVRFYKNTGTNTTPAFASYSYLKAAGADIKMTGG